jgi:hypothetical protein
MDWGSGFDRNSDVECSKEPASEYQSPYIITIYYYSKHSSLLNFI